MKTNLIIQNSKENSLIEVLKGRLEDAKKLYVISSSFKESGFELLEEELIDSKIKSKFIIGVDKKNTTKLMLEALLKLTKDVSYYINNGDVEFNSNYIIVENTFSAFVYSIDSVSESALSVGIGSILVVEYDLKNKEDKELYKELIKKFISLEAREDFYILDKASIDKLVENKEIFSTRQYNHTVMSISELLNKNAQNEENKKEETKEEKVEIPKVDLSDIDFDIDLSADEMVVPVEEKKSKKSKKEDKNDLDIKIDDDVKKLNIKDTQSVEDIVDKDSEFYDEELEDINFDENDTLDINDLLFEKADVKLKKNKQKKEDTKKEEEELVGVKKVNLNNVSNLIMQLPQRPQKGQDLSNVKVPNYIKQMIPEFFDLNSENAKNESINGSMYKLRNIEIEIVDAKTGEKYKDSSAKLMQKQNQTYLTFTTDEMKNITYNEKDIVRIIKLSNNVYHIEIISQDLSEYKIWDKLCNQNMKSTDRRFGVM